MQLGDERCASLRQNASWYGQYAGDIQLLSWCPVVVEKTARPNERVKVVVQPSASHPDILSIQDAMRQVLDFFDLLTPEDEDSTHFVWNLKVATTNSPLTVEGEAVSLSPDLDVTVLAVRQKAILEDSLNAIRQGKIPSKFLSRRRRTTLRRLFVRNMNGIGRTEAILTTPNEPVLVTPKIAQQGVRFLDIEDSEMDSLLLKDRQREERGSLEGVLLDVGMEYNRPAILIRERKSGRDIWCRVSEEQSQEISSSATFADVWSRKRVLVKGRIRYDKDGNITRVFADSIRSISPRKMMVRDISDRDFTYGLDVRSYLDLLREGEGGQ